MKTYDILVLGGGPGGYVAAIKAAQLGAKVALVEKEVVGGICLNHGCIPTKTFLKSAKTFKTLQHSEDYGITKSGEVNFDWTKIVARKDGVVKQLTGGVAFLLKKNGVDVYNGYGEVLSPTQVKVGNETLEAKNLVLATGASAIVPPIPGVKEAYEKGTVVTSRELLNVKTAPKTLVIVGGGVIGVEFATVFNSFGSKVVIVEKMDGILPTMDDDVRTAYTKRLKADGIEVLTGAEVKSVDGKKLTYNLNGKDVTIDSDLILMAVGTRANSQGFEKLNLTMDRANVVTNEYLQTNVPNVYAIGDLNGKFMLAHVASHEGIIAVEHALKKGHTKMRYDRIPSCIYGSPEIAAIGLTEKEAKEKGLDYKVSKVPLAAVGKALADGEKEGFVKLIVDKKYLEVIGAHIYAYNATELISEYATAMELEGTAYEIAHAIHPHPTLSELTMEAALGAIDKPIHI
ncbi:Dihydrolipoyl dehydrogenase (Lpd/PdhD) [Alteracholeplasma palmae J233]|uniref:Dihydrolipoyl dehydrogenase n=1 Tax=Alteracholeplasma palmae (strain ATCC 49389 / J233) TaxID=1318466 RepID=U4KQZ5_ALTPJ|nr:dihydrolipoyl dehydrogenase [Alteracholeplasma palmae]CCV63731.1 Dihydrolipoyl dehydrogenase (Lpd/PdhD) [Alteracholeplasma palmae J233]